MAKTAPKVETATAAKAPETASITPAVTATVPPAETKAKAKTVKVEVLRSHPEFGYWPGDKAEVPQDVFDRIQKTGAFFQEQK